MANRNRFGSMALTKEFAQASMKFVMKNPAVDGGCKIGYGFDEEMEEEDGKSMSEFVPLTGKPQIDYIESFFDANYQVNWHNVVHVRMDMLNSTENACPVCMEPLSDMVCPRITKCGHIFCWSCILAYLDYDCENSWKRCPLCYDPVYRSQLKPVQVNVAQNYQSGQKIAFDLMVRSKANNLVKNKFRVSQLAASAAAAGQHLEHAVNELYCN